MQTCCTRRRDHSNASPIDPAHLLWQCAKSTTSLQHLSATPFLSLVQAAALRSEVGWVHERPSAAAARTDAAGQPDGHGVELASVALAQASSPNARQPSVRRPSLSSMTASAVDAECGTAKTAAQSGAASTEGGLDEEDEESIDGLSVQRCLCRLEKAVARFKAQKAREDLGGELLQEVRAMGQRLDAIVETVSVVKAQNDELEKLAGNDSLRRIDSMHETLVELSVWKIQQAQLVDQLEVAVQCVGDRCDLLNISAADARAEEAEWRSKMSTKHDQVTAVVSKLEGYVQQTMLIEETLGKELKQVKSRSVRHGTAIAELPKMQSVLAELEEERIEVPRSRIVEAEQAVVQFKKDVGKLLETKVSVDLVPTIATKSDLSKVDAKVEMQLTAFEAQKKLLYATHEEVAKAGIGVKARGFVHALHSEAPRTRRTDRRVL